MRGLTLSLDSSFSYMKVFINSDLFWPEMILGFREIQRLFLVNEFTFVLIGQILRPPPKVAQIFDPFWWKIDHFSGQKLSHWEVTKPLSTEGNIPSNLNMWDPSSDHINYGFPYFKFSVFFKRIVTFQNFNILNSN